MTSAQFRKMQNAVCSVSTGCDGRNEYYNSVGGAISAVDSALEEFGYCVDPTDWMVRANGKNFSDPNGCRVVVDCVDSSDCIVCQAVLSFFRVQSGRYELTAYLA